VVGRRDFLIGPMRRAGRWKRTEIICHLLEVIDSWLPAARGRSSVGPGNGTILVGSPFHRVEVSESVRHWVSGEQAHLLDHSASGVVLSEVSVLVSAAQGSLVGQWGG